LSLPLPPPFFCPSSFSLLAWSALLGCRRPETTKRQAGIMKEGNADGEVTITAWREDGKKE
jgi:hypothetical protein